MPGTAEVGAGAVVDVCVDAGAAARSRLPAMGNPAVERYDVDTYRNFTIVDTNNPATCTGRIEAVSFFAERPGAVRFVVAAPDRVVTFVSEEVTVPGAGRHTVALRTPAGVQPGSNIGAYSATAGVISWEPSVHAAPAYFSTDDAGLCPVGQLVGHEGRLPRRYSLSASVIPATRGARCDHGTTPARPGAKAAMAVGTRDVAHEIGRQVAEMLLPGRHVFLRGRSGSGRSTVLTHVVRALATRRADVVGPCSALGGIRIDLPVGAAAGRPLVVAVDDLDTLDDLSAIGLRRALEARQAWMLGVITDDRSLPRPLQRLGGRPPAVVEMPALHPVDADTLMWQVRGRALDAPTRRELLRLADGRLGVLAELLDDLGQRELDSEGISGPGADDPRLHLGSRVRRRTETVLGGLDLRQRRILERVALAGSIPVELLADDDLDVADEVSRLGLLRADAAGTVHVTDPLVQTMLVADLTPITRRLHRRWLAHTATDTVTSSATAVAATTPAGLRPTPTADAHAAAEVEDFLRRGPMMLLDDLDALDAQLQQWRPTAPSGHSVRWWLSAEVAAFRGDPWTAVALLRTAEAEASDLDSWELLRAIRWTAVRVAAVAGIGWSDVGMVRPEVDEPPWTAPHAIPAAVARVWKLVGADRVADAIAMAWDLIAAADDAIPPAVVLAHTALRIGAPAAEVLRRLPHAAQAIASPVLQAMVRHIEASVAGDRGALLEVAQSFAAAGHVLLAAEVRAQAGFASLPEHLPPTPLLRQRAPTLTPRERELVHLVREGLSNAQVADRLTLSVRTVETHLSAAYRKLGVTNRQQLVSL